MPDHHTCRVAGKLADYFSSAYANYNGRNVAVAEKKTTIGFLRFLKLNLL